MSARFLHCNITIHFLSILLEASPQSWGGEGKVSNDLWIYVKTTTVTSKNFEGDILRVCTCLVSPLSLLPNFSIQLILPAVLTVMVF